MRSSAGAHPSGPGAVGGAVRAGPKDPALPERRIRFRWQRHHVLSEGLVETDRALDRLAVAVEMGSHDSAMASSMASS